MAAQLNFIETFTVEQFKDRIKESSIDVRENPKTNKLFMSYGSRGGKVSLKGIPTNPMISLCHDSLTRIPTDEESAYIGVSIMNAEGQRVAHPKANGYFHLLHEEGQGGAPVLATF